MAFAARRCLLPLLVAAPLACVPPAAASPSGLVISEVYGGGGNAGAPLRNDFIELHNTSSAPIALDGMSVQYRSATGTGTGVTPLRGTVPAGRRWLVSQAAGANTAAAPLPTPDATGTLSMAAGGGIVLLASTTGAVAVPPGNVNADPDADADADAIVDLVGYGSAAAFEGTGPAPGLSNTTAASRSSTSADTNQNGADFAAGVPEPQSSGPTGPVDPQPPPEPVERTIAHIQGTGSASPLAGSTVVTRGVVTASYPTGGLRGFTIQTPGTGGALDLGTHRASDGLFVFVANGTSYPEIGDHVSVRGMVSEFGGLTEITAEAGGVQKLSEPVAAPSPASVTFPGSPAEREVLESMTISPRGPWTVTDTFTLNRYAEIGLARGTEPLRQPTDVARPGPAADAVAADNAARRVTLDDGASIDFLPFRGGPHQDVALPYLSQANPVRVGAPVTFTKPVVVDYRNNAWKLQPTRQVTGDTGSSTSPVRIADTRTDRPEDVGGAVRIASFNVLNYFTETGGQWVADGGTCTWFVDRDDEPITNDRCSGEGPRGAADEEDLQRQQAKIVAAVNRLGADVVSLEEIENSAKYGPDRDAALASLVRALNAAAGSQVWSFVPSPKVRPAAADEDVIRTAFIYRRAGVRPVGASRILVGDPAFEQAREPLAQQFVPLGDAGSAPFLVVVNHFKSKGSGADDGTGQSLGNPDRVAQSEALLRFTAAVQRDTRTQRVFLVGDFNAYTYEDPMVTLYDAGYTDVGERFTGESTYLFGGVVGSLDHVLANGPALASVTGADVWNINSVESVAFEYSRFNYNATSFYAPDPFRASDHDPLLVGISRR